MASKTLPLILGAILGIGIITLHAQQSTVATGGDGTGSGGTFSFSTGLTDYFYITDHGGSMQYGMQQCYDYFLLFTWAGDEDSGWMSGANWDTGEIPAEGHDVLIPAGRPNYPVLEEQYRARHLYIQPDASLVIAPAGKLSVIGELRNNAGIGALILQSALIAQDDTLASRTGSLIHDTPGVDATISRYMTGGWDTWDAGWHLIASPVTSQPIADFIAQAQHGSFDFYGWDEPTETWKNYHASGFEDWNQGPQFNPGQGYLISFEQDQDALHFSGEVHVSDIQKSGLSITGDEYSGWHLLGNPFASALVWNDTEGHWSLNEIAGVAKIWIESGKSYTDILSDGIIPASQGFWVQAGDALNSLTIPAGARTHSDQPYYKSSPAEKIKLRVMEEGGRSFQESQIVVNPGADFSFTFCHDSRFMPGYAPHFYSLKDTEKLSTYALPDLCEGIAIPYGFRKNNGNAFAMELVENSTGIPLYLQDLKLGIMHHLGHGYPYRFTSDQGDDPLRFTLHPCIEPPMEIMQPEDNRPGMVWVHGNTLYVRSADASLKITLYSIGGVRLQEFNPGIGDTAYPLTLAAGAYLLHIHEHQAVRTQKFIMPHQ